jgi:hypothetical protein
MAVSLVPPMDRKMMESSMDTVKASMTASTKSWGRLPKSPKDFYYLR